MKRFLAFSLAAILLAATIIEFLGHRISDADFGGLDLLSASFLFSALQTAAGAAAVGFMFAGIGYILNRIAGKTRVSLIILWNTGSLLFLLIMLLLVLWAP